jgi:hypothetical protein
MSPSSRSAISTTGRNAAARGVGLLGLRDLLGPGGSQHLTEGVTDLWLCIHE